MANFDKNQLSETDIKTKFITPAIERAGWNIQTQMLEEYTITAGRIRVRGKMWNRGKAKRADYVLFHKPGIPLAIVEAKDNKHTVGSGMQQALGYAEMMDVPFAFSSNGDGFLFHDRLATTGTVESELALDAFPPPNELWARLRDRKAYDGRQEEIITQDYYDDGSGKKPRYYQLTAINRAVEAIARGEDRVLLVMATGTGKTFTAFQIIHRLWKAGVKKRILFLADRNILVDQTKTNDFKPFGTAMTKITKRKVDPSYEIYLSLYQAITGPEEAKKIYREFSPDFFDLIVIDECHRGSAAEDSAWREILDYFKSAAHVGLTATPKETEYVSNINYFGEPVYTYSLKQGIDDGFLAPYKVVRIDLDKDLTGWRPEAGKLDKHGEEIEDRVYNQKDFDKTLVMEQRTKLVAAKVSQFLRETDPYTKTIIFCEDIDHAERMRQALVNENPEHVAENHRYVMRITGDNAEGKAELDNFIDPEARYPVIAVTSRLMTTGVDAQTCGLIVLDRRIQSMTEFKQIIGRGTRVNEDYGKMYFTIMDFRKSTELFADPDFDGDPVQIYVPKDGETPVPPDEDPEGGAGTDAFIDPISGDEDPPDHVREGDGEYGGDSGGTSGKGKKIYVNDVPFAVVAEREQFMDPKTGKLITESFKEYTRKVILEQYDSLDAFLKTWKEADKHQVILDELAEQGIFWDELANAVGKELSAFDLVCHIAFDQPPLTRRERAENVRKQNYFTEYGEEARAVLDALLEKFADEGIAELENIETLKVKPVSDLGTPMEIVRQFGGKDGFIAEVRKLEDALYDVG